MSPTVDSPVNPGPPGDRSLADVGHIIPPSTLTPSVSVNDVVDLGDETFLEYGRGIRLPYPIYRLLTLDCRVTPIRSQLLHSSRDGGTEQIAGGNYRTP